jgi:acyl carrier protein
VTAEVTLVDETGAVLVEIGEFVRRRVDTDAVSAKVVADRTVTAAVRTDERGIRPAQGAAAFRRLLDADLGTQIVINTEPLAEMLARVRRSPADRTADDAPAPDLPAVDTRSAGPGSELEKILCEIWAGTIGVDRVGVDDDFFGLGGNSLVAVQLISRVSKEAGVRLPMRTLFETPTVGGLAARIEQLRTAEPVPEQRIARLSRER